MIKIEIKVVENIWTWKISNDKTDDVVEYKLTEEYFPYEVHNNIQLTEAIGKTFTAYELELFKGYRYESMEEKERLNSILE